MKLPYIVLIDDDEQVLRAIQRDIRNKYREEYKIAATDSATEALELIKELKLKNETVALFISDQRMPEMEGIAFLEKAKEIYPEAKQVFLTAYSDIEAAIRAINNVKLDYYLLKPWDPPEEKLYPVLDDLIEDWLAEYRPPFEGVRLIGHRWSARSHEIKDLLARNQVPFQWLDVETSEDARELLLASRVTPTPEHLPIVVTASG